jgi:hypothetical protein
MAIKLGVDPFLLIWMNYEVEIDFSRVSYGIVAWAIGIKVFQDLALSFLNTNFAYSVQLE